MMKMDRWLLMLLAFAGLHCAPHAPAPPKGKGPVVAAPPVKVPDPLRDRIQAALDHVHKRDLLTTHGFWTIFHGILGMGPESTMLLDPKTEERFYALDYIAKGNPVRGLEFPVTKHGLDVTIAKPGTRIELFVGQGHQDQFVAEMIQWGVAPERPFIVDGKKFTFQDFINHSKMRASTTQKQELSWAVLVVGEHFGTEHAWTNERGESITMEDVLRYELKQDMDTAACGGTHRLFGLTWVLHRHKERGHKIDGVWKDVVAALEQHKLNAKKQRNGDGCFSTDYFKGRGDKDDIPLRISTTGHILEWLALYLPDKELREPWVEDAAAALARLVLISAEDAIEGGALYHAAHGLHLYHDRAFGDPKAKRPYPLP